MFYWSSLRPLKLKKAYQVNKCYIIYEVINGKLQLLMRDQSKRRRKLEEVKELEHIYFDSDIKNAAL